MITNELIDKVGKPLQMKYAEWTLIDWDGNPDLKLKCWRKTFGKGHVSVGCGDFHTIVYSYGANSIHSLSSTRWRPYGVITEDTAKAEVDANAGRYYPSKA